MHVKDALFLDQRIRLHLCNNLSTSRFTDVQGLMVPAIIKGRSVVVVAPANSGKTAGYLIPIVHSAMKRYYRRDDNKCNTNPMFVVVCSTARVANRVYFMATQLNYLKALKINCLEYSVISQRMEKLLFDGTDIFVTTPPALVAALEERVSAQ